MGLYQVGFFGDEEDRTFHISQMGPIRSGHFTLDSSNSLSEHDFSGLAGVQIQDGVDVNGNAIMMSFGDYLMKYLHNPNEGHQDGLLLIYNHSLVPLVEVLIRYG